MDRFDQAMATLKAENKRLEKELNQVDAAIAALQGASNNGRRITARHSRWRLLVRRPLTTDTSGV